MDDILKILIGKNNELESMKSYITDDASLNVIKAKQDTIEDIYQLIEDKWVGKMLSIGE